MKILINLSILTFAVVSALASPNVDRELVDRLRLLGPNVDPVFVQRLRLLRPDVNRVLVDRLRVLRSEEIGLRADIPIVNRLGAVRPVVERLREDHPVVGRLREDHPVVGRLREDHPVVQRLRVDHPVVQRLRVDHPVVERLREDQPVVERLREDHPVVGRLRADHPDVERLREDQPVISTRILSSVNLASPDHSTNYLEAIRNWQTSYEEIYKLAKKATVDGNDQPTYFSMLLKAVVEMGLNIYRNQTDYNEVFLNVSVSAMKTVLDDPQQFAEAIKTNYASVYNSRVRLILGLKDKLCSPSEYHCDDLIESYYQNEVPLLDILEQTALYNARDVLFYTSEAFDVILKQYLNSYYSLINISKMNQPVLFYLSRPDEAYFIVKAVADAIWKIFSLH